MHWVSSESGKVKVSPLNCSRELPDRSKQPATILQEKDLFLSLKVQVPILGLWIVVFKTTAELGNRDWDQDKLNVPQSSLTKIRLLGLFVFVFVFWGLGFSSIFFTKCLPFCCMLLVSFQNSKRVDSEFFAKYLLLLWRNELFKFPTLPFSLMLVL